VLLQVCVINLRKAGTDVCSYRYVFNLRKAGVDEVVCCRYV